MEIKEAIRVIKEGYNGVTWTEESSRKYREAIQFAISKLSLLEQVENMGGVKKSKPEDHLCDKEWQSRTNPEPCTACVRDNIINLSQADLARKLEGIETELPDMLAEAQVETIPNSAIYDIDVKKLIQLLTAHFTNPERR